MQGPLNRERADFYTSILRSELQPALGCTEPIAIAYAASAAAKALGCFPEKVRVCCSGNIIKNVKSVIVPNTGKLRGVETAALAGFLSARPEAGLQVLESLNDEDRQRLRSCLDSGMCTVGLLETPHCLHATIEAEGEGHTVMVELLDSHTHLSRLVLDGRPLLNETISETVEAADCASGMNLREIWAYCTENDYAPVADILHRQIECNLRIAQEGLTGRYGVAVGQMLLSEGSHVRNRARAYAAAGSDARMSGCVLPVVINSGSGNQGMTVSLPVWVYAKDMGATEEQLLRALMLSNLVSIFAKHDIGKLSAYCGAVTASCGAGAAIAWLHGGDFAAVCRTIINTLANVSGMICDGAKPSCAAKIATALDAALIGEQLGLRGRSFGAGEGIVGQNTDETVRNVGELARDGMQGTDLEILKIMTR